MNRAREAAGIRGRSGFGCLGRPWTREASIGYPARPRFAGPQPKRKEDVAREIAERDGVTEGLVCVLTAVEPCHTFTVGPNRERKRLELRAHPGKCLHQYFYVIDP